MKSAGEQEEVITVDAEVVVVERGRPDRNTATTTTTTISNSSSNSSTSSEPDDEDNDGENNAVNDHHHQENVHVVDVVNLEQSLVPASSAAAPASSVIVVSSSTNHNDYPQQQPVNSKNSCDTCATRVTDHHRSKSLPHGGKKVTSGGGTNLGDSSEITTIRELTSEQSNSVSGVLRFCKRRVLFPYLKLLGAMGLKPLYSDGNNRCVLTLSKLYLILVGLVLIIGYSLQLMTCFRRDHGFSYKKDFLSAPTSLHDDMGFYNLEVDSNGNMSHAELYKGGHKNNNDEENWILENTICTGNVIYVYIVPSILHLISFIYMVYLYWIYDDEHLQNLMERVFIQAAHANINFFSQRRLVRRLQGLVGIGTLWIGLLTFCQVAQVFLNKIYFNIWIEFEYNWTNAMSAVLLFATLWQDAIQVTIVISFAIQCNLICTYTELIKGRLMQHSISLQECMKELGELGQLLSYLNNDLALGLAPLLLIDGIYAAGAITHLIRNGKNLSFVMLPLLVLTAALWIFIIAFPLAQAASVSTCCQNLKDMGHIIRIRPFGYQFVPQFDLDSFLLFVSNLNLKATILKIPITSPILSVVAISLSAAVLLWGYFQ